MPPSRAKKKKLAKNRPANTGTRKPAGAASGRGGRKPPGAARVPKRPAKRRHAATPASPAEGERLQKVLAAAGVASRRECEELIREGRVEVDGALVMELGARVDPMKQTIFLDGEALPSPKRVYFAVNKPEGVVCSARDPSGRERVIDLLPPDAGRVFNVGRLDLASEGLILVTNDGELANQLTHPRHGVEKTYHVQVAGHPTVETLAQLRKGVRLAEGTAHFVHAKIKSRRKKSTVLEVVLDEGRNREIRRVLARVDHKVQKLVRVAVGPVRLADMPPGAYRPLTAQEVKALRASVDAPKADMAPALKRSPKRPRKKPTAAAAKPTAKRRVIGDTGDEAQPGKAPRKKTGAGGWKGRGPKKAGAKKPAANGSGRPTKKKTKRPAAAGKKPAKRKPRNR